MKKTNNAGITLIALVITIIVLLILAGISIAMLTGSNGILTKANESDYVTIRAEAEERINLALDGAFTDLLTQKYVKGAEASLDDSHVISENGLDEDAATKKGGKFEVKVTPKAEPNNSVVEIKYIPGEGYGEPFTGKIVAQDTTGDKLAYKVEPADAD